MDVDVVVMVFLVVVVDVEDVVDVVVSWSVVVVVFVLHVSLSHSWFSWHPHLLHFSISLPARHK